MKADDLQKQCTNIEAQDVQDNLQFFEVLTLKRKSKGKHLALFITWIFLFLTTYLIINQFMLIFSQ